MSRYTHNSMTPVTIIDRLNAFKDAIDNRVDTFLSMDMTQAAKDAVNYKRVGGLHHWRIGRLGGSVFVKKAPRATKPVKYEPTPEVAIEEPTMTELERLKLDWRVNTIQKRKTSDVGAYVWSE